MFSPQMVAGLLGGNPKEEHVNEILQFHVELARITQPEFNI